ncbi:unnamed protein product [Closterium sp. Naga37s-1]|nr:unnamed protein product [Closterium sp. Naga37s-1]
MKCFSRQGFVSILYPASLRLDLFAHPSPPSDPSPVLNPHLNFQLQGISFENDAKEQISAYRDRRFRGTQEEFEQALKASTTVYVGNLSFYTTEEQIYEVFSKAGEIRRIVMGLDKNTMTPCGFCFVAYYVREDAEDAVKYVSSTILDDRPIRVDFDWGYEDGRQWGRGRSGGQGVPEGEGGLRGGGGGRGGRGRSGGHVRGGGGGVEGKSGGAGEEYRTDYDPDMGVRQAGGYGKLVQKEISAIQQYGAPLFMPGEGGSPGGMPPSFGHSPSVPRQPMSHRMQQRLGNQQGPRRAQRYSRDDRQKGGYRDGGGGGGGGMRKRGRDDDEQMEEAGREGRGGREEGGERRGGGRDGGGRARFRERGDDSDDEGDKA